MSPYLSHIALYISQICSEVVSDLTYTSLNKTLNSYLPDQYTVNGFV